MKLKTKILYGLSIIPALILLMVPNQVLALTCKGGSARSCLADPSVAPIMDKLTFIVRFMTAVVGVIAVIMLIVGGIQYITASGNPQSVADAKKKITNVLIGVLAFIFLWAFIEWIVPGGIGS